MLRRAYPLRRVAYAYRPCGSESRGAPREFVGAGITKLRYRPAERQARTAAALQRLDERCDGLRQRQRHARQEQIIEEVEVALSVSGVSPPGPEAS